jgi:hypothetical protein
MTDKELIKEKFKNDMAQIHKNLNLYMDDIEKFEEILSKFQELSHNYKKDYFGK